MSRTEIALVRARPFGVRSVAYGHNPCAVGANGRAPGQPVILGLPLFLSAARVLPGTLPGQRHQPEEVFYPALHGKMDQHGNVQTVGAGG